MVFGEEEMKLVSVQSYPYYNSLIVSPYNEDIAWISYWERERFGLIILSPDKQSPRIELEYAITQKPSGFAAIQHHVFFIADNKLLVTWPLDTSSARFLLLDAESGKELALMDVPDFRFYSLCINNIGNAVAATKDSKNVLVVYIEGDKLTHSIIPVGDTYGPKPYFAPNNRLYALHYQSFFSIEGDKAVFIGNTNEANSVAFDLVGNVYFGGGFHDRSGPSSLQIVELDSGKSKNISWSLEPIDVIKPSGNDKLLLGNMVTDSTATRYPRSQVTLFHTSQMKREWTLEFTDILPYYEPILLSVPEQDWALLQSGQQLMQVSLNSGKVLVQFPKEKSEFVQACWLNSHRILCISRNCSKADPGQLELYKIE